MLYSEKISVMEREENTGKREEDIYIYILRDQKSILSLCIDMVEREKFWAAFQYFPTRLLFPVRRGFRYHISCKGKDYILCLKQLREKLKISRWYALTTPPWFVFHGYP